MDRIEDLLEQVRAVPDLLERVRAASDTQNLFKDGEVELARIRRDALEELITQGATQADLARALGVTGARMSQLLKAGPPAERAFFGATSRHLVVAVAEKREADKPKPGPVVAIDDMYAYDLLRGLATDLGFTSSYEVVRPPGNVRLNREGLVIICGPRHSPLIAQILEADDNLAFEKDDTWHLVDRQAGTVYRSPEDSGEPGDIAYLGRLPRPDGKGTFLYLAGIHAAGSAGVVHWLCNELPALHRQVRGKRFSTLVACRYDPDTHQVTSSHRITPIYEG